MEGDLNVNGTVSLNAAEGGSDPGGAGFMPSTGLSDAEVAERIAAGKINGDINVKTKSVARILRTNIVTFFNILFLAIAFVMAFFVEHNLEGLFNYGFLMVAVVNCIIGISQELAAKRTIDKLSLLHAPKARALRNGEEREIALKEIVLDDILLLRAGNEIAADAVVVEGAVEVNEALITGEPDAIIKREGDELLSGSFVVSGTAKVRVEHVGKDNYAARITADAKKQKPQNSEIYRGLNKIIKFMSIVLVPLGAALFCVKYFLQGGSDAVNETVLTVLGTLIGMIPSGLVALTSAVFCVSVVRLAKRKALAQDLYCSEILARVDVLCLDKTGTITEGSMTVRETVPKNASDAEIRQALKALTEATGDANPTADAIKDYVSDLTEYPPAVGAVPFSSVRKWSGANFDGYSLVMGAAEFVLGDAAAEIAGEIGAYAEKGYRVMALCRAAEHIDVENKTLPAGLSVTALIVIEDVLRKGAGETLEYFDRQGVTIKIISGDNPVTVSAVAARAGVRNAEKYVDASELDEEELNAAADKYTVFGRVSPDQKLALVKALKAAGHVVGMTGDGINDVLALREADCSIAVAAGSDASKNVSKIVLLDNNFGSLPGVVQEGRRCINNLQRSASLFLIKTIYNTLFALLFMIIPAPLPFIPKNLTLIGYITIGPPAFVLALEPNSEIVKGRFLPKVIRNACPTAFAIVAAVCVISAVGQSKGMPFEQICTSAIIATGILGLAFIIKISWPFNRIRVAMIAVLAAFFALCFVMPFTRTLFGLSATYGIDMLILTAPSVAGGILLMTAFTLAFKHMRLPKFLAKFFEKL